VIALPPETFSVSMCATPAASLWFHPPVAVRESSSRVGPTAL